jgi:photosystem II stability/assembly factor-like uncharacterized protein
MQDGGIVTRDGDRFDIVVGTEDGVVGLAGGMRRLGLEGHRVSAIYAFREPGRTDPVLLAGTYGEGLRRSEDGGETWQPVEGMTAPAVRTLGPDPLDAGALLCGTEPARLFRSTDGGATWSELAGISALPEHAGWFLPYSPRAGAVRNVDAVPGDLGHAVASVEVGGMLRSTDGGKTWSIEEIAGNDDIHQVTGDPLQPGRVWASLGYAALPTRTRHPGDRHLGGVARSDDAGRTWSLLHTDYTRSTIPVPGVPGVVVSGPAPRVGEAGRIATSGDEGATWQPAADGIETPMPDMVELFMPAPDGSVFAVCSGGRLLRAEPDRWRWASVLPDPRLKAASVAFVPR